MSKRHQEGLAHLLYGIEYGGGFVALTGEVGTGKTTLCHCLLKQLPENIDLALILNSRLNANELVATLCDELAIKYDKSSNSLKYLIDLLNQHLLSTHAKGRQTVLLIDEAQNLSMEVLEQLRLLTNLETTKTKLLRIILVGQPELKDLLQRQDLRQLNQRITARYHLTPLTLQETRAYIRHRLHVSHGDVELFKDSAIKKVYQLTEGIPRLINLLCDRSLLGAYSANVYKVKKAIVVNAAIEILPEKQDKKGISNTALFSILFGLFALGFYLFATQDNLKTVLSSIKSLNIPNTESQTNTVTIPTNPQPVQVNESLTVVEPPKNTLEPNQVSAIPQTPTVETIKPFPSLAFSKWLNNRNHNLENALNDMLIKWNKTVPTNQKTDCALIQITGLRCKLGKASWKDILLMNKPVILEFVSKDKSKNHALVTGYSKQQSIIHFNDDIKFATVDILKYWEGYYLQLEAPVLTSDNLILYPKKISENVLWLRYVLNTFDGKTTLVGSPLYFDETLSKRLQHFQHEKHLDEDGKVGPKTLISLKNYAQTFEYPQLTINE